MGGHGQAWSPPAFVSFWGVSFFLLVVDWWPMASWPKPACFCGGSVFFLVLGWVVGLELKKARSKGSEFGEALNWDEALFSLALALWIMNNSNSPCCSLVRAPNQTRQSNSWFRFQRYMLATAIKLACEDEELDSWGNRSQIMMKWWASLMTGQMIRSKVSISLRLFKTT